MLVTQPEDSPFHNNPARGARAFRLSQSAIAARAPESKKTQNSLSNFVNSVQLCELRKFVITLTVFDCLRVHSVPLLASSFSSIAASRPREHEPAPEDEATESARG